MTNPNLLRAPAEARGASDDILRTTLDELLRSGSTSNPALNRLLDDYTTYHLVLVVVGGIFLLGCVLLSIGCWKRFTTAPTVGRSWTFEKRTYLSFAVLGAVLSAQMAVVIAANVSNVLDPRRGFAGSLSLIGSARAGTGQEALHQAFTTWLQSDSSETPPLVQRAIDARLTWQQPKAILSLVLLVVFVWLCVRIWRTLIIRSRIRESRIRESDRNLRAVGLRLARWASVATCLLLMLMTVGNTQASFAPLCLTLFNG